MPSRQPDANELGAVTSHSRQADHLASRGLEFEEDQDVIML